MASEVKVNLKPVGVIELSLGINENGPAQAYFTSRCAEHMDKYIPFRTGGLSRYNRVVNTDSIEYNSPYAHYMYEGKVMGPNIPIKENGIIVKWFSRKPKEYTGADIDYSLSRAQAGHEYAGPYWDERMWSAEKDEVTKEVADFIKARGGS